MKNEKVRFGLSYLTKRTACPSLTVLLGMFDC